MTHRPGSLGLCQFCTASYFHVSLEEEAVWEQDYGTPCIRCVQIRSHNFHLHRISAKGGAWASIHLSAFVRVQSLLRRLWRLVAMIGTERLPRPPGIFVFLKQNNIYRDGQFLCKALCFSSSSMFIHFQILSTFCPLCSGLCKCSDFIEKPSLTLSTPSALIHILKFSFNLTDICASFDVITVPNMQRLNLT